MQEGDDQPRHVEDTNHTRRHQDLVATRRALPRLRPPVGSGSAPDVEEADPAHQQGALERR